MSAKLPADIASCAMSEHESEGVDDGHQRKYHAGRAADAGSELADKKGVCHVVHHGDKAADDARNRHCGYCTRYRRFAEESIIIQIVHVPYFGNLTIVSIEAAGQPALR